MKLLSDNELVKQYCSGKREAADELYRRYNPYAISVIYRMRGQHIGEPEDLAHEAFLLFLRKAHQFRGDASFGSWFHRIVVNVVLEKYRHKREHIPFVAEEHGPKTDIIISKDLQFQELGLFHKQCQELFWDLPISTQIPFALWLTGYSFVEIAKALKHSHSRVKSLVWRARKTMPDSYKKKFPAHGVRAMVPPLELVSVSPVSNL